MIKRMVLSSVLTLCILTTGACNNIPIDGLQAGFTFKVSKSQENTDPVKVDFLWVIDNSASMCQEQAQLAQSFDEFIKKIQSFVNIDFRIAVVTTDMLSDGHRGKFRHHLAKEFPFACAQNRIEECLPDVNGDQICAKHGTNWECDGPDDPKKLYNCNATVNSECKKRCADAAECDLQFVGAEQAEKCAANTSACVYKCLQPSNDPKNSNYVLRPETSQCPDTNELYKQITSATGNATPWLIPSNAEALFKCIGVVGAEQHTNANLEQGLNAAIYALNKHNPENRDQAKAFLRDDAYLVTVFISDEDDCSVAPGKSLKKEKFGTCICVPDTQEDPIKGKLLPPMEAANMIKALKSDPSQVLVAAIVGDSTATNPEVRDLERTLYTSSKCGICENPADKHPLLFNTYICHSDSGKADYGRRYREFIERFGDNGIFTNICDAAGISPALTTIADRIIRVFTKICLPKPIKDQQTLKVAKRGPQGKCSGTTDDGEPAACNIALPCSNGSPCVLEEKILQEKSLSDSNAEEKESYQILVSSDCPEEAGKKAVFFNFLLEPGTIVSIDYLACDPSLDPDCTGVIN